MSYEEKPFQLSLSSKIMKSKKKKNRLIKYIIDFIARKNHEVKGNATIVCPYCHSKHSIKNGKNNNKQRYFCKNCSKSYIDVTNSVVYHTRKSLSVWKKYVTYLVNQYSLRECAAMLNIDLKTAFFWRHKILDALEQQLELGELSGEIQMNTIHIKCNFKGNHRKSFFKMPRMSYKRGPNSIEELVSRDHVCVMGAMNYKGDVIMKPICINNPKVDDMVNAFGKVIKQGSLLVTNTRYNYKEFAKICNVEHISIKRYSVCSSSYNVSKITNFLRNYEYFVKPYRGIATKYISGYISLYKYIENKLYTKGKYVINDNNKLRFINSYNTIPLFKCSTYPYFNKRLREKPVLFKNAFVLEPVLLW